MRHGPLKLAAAETARERLVSFVLAACAAITILTTIAVVFVLARETLAFFLDPAVTLWGFLTDRTWTPLFATKTFGIAPLLAGTFLVTGIALAVGVPMGLASAIYLSEFASDRLRRRATSILEVLAGISGGESNRAIALRLGISVRTVDRHVSNVLDKLGVASRAEAAAFAARHGLA